MNTDTQYKYQKHDSILKNTFNANPQRKVLLVISCLFLIMSSICQSERLVSKCL